MIRREDRCGSGGLGQPERCRPAGLSELSGVRALSYARMARDAKIRRVFRNLPS